jgi:hypothetical protein
MITLDSTNKTMEVLLAAVPAANQLPFVASYTDWDPTNLTQTLGSNDGTTNGTTAATVVTPPPAAGVTRVINFLSFYNKDTSPATVTVRLNNTGLVREEAQYTLPAGKTLQYTRSGGWNVPFDGAGGGGGGGTVTANQGLAAALAGAWPVELTDGTNLLGALAHPLRVDPTGTTTQPVSGTVAVSGTVPVSGTFWQATQPVSGTVTANQGSPPWATNVTQFGGGGVLTGTGASGTGVPRVTVSNDSSLAAHQSVNLDQWNGVAPSPPVTLGYGTANPTAPPVASCHLLWNGSSWDPACNLLYGSLLPSAVRNAFTQATAVYTHGCKGVTCYLSVTAASGTGGLNVNILAIDPVSGNGPVMNAQFATPIKATGIYGFQIYPGANAPATASMVYTAAALMGNLFIAQVTHGDGSNYTYSLGYVLVP